MLSILLSNEVIAQNTVSGKVYNDIDGSAKGNFANILTGANEIFPFLKVTARYFTNNDTYGTLPGIYSPSTYTIAASGGLELISSNLQYHIRY